MAQTQRLPFTTFSFPVPEIRAGYYSAVYFWREKMILEKEGNRNTGLMQVFNKFNNAVICGLDEALAILRAGTGYWRDEKLMHSLFDEYILTKKNLKYYYAHKNWALMRKTNLRLFDISRRLDCIWEDTHENLCIRVLNDGDQSPAHDAVMTIEGVGHEFAHLESLYLGVIARGTKIATNTKKVVDSAKKKPVLFFADRFDRWQNQTADGYAAMKAGAFGVATNAMGKWWGIDGTGTIPHALIAFYEGNTVAASLAFAKNYPSINSIALVDFDNDCVNTSLEVAYAFMSSGFKLWGVRLDTSGSIVDKSVMPQMGQFKPTGVCPQLVYNVRRALDAEGFKDVKIIVSGGFNPDKIELFEKIGVPVDAYGVGSSLLRGNYDHTADIVKVNRKPISKTGRKYRPGPRLNKFNWSEIE